MLSLNKAVWLLSHLCNEMNIQTMIQNYGPRYVCHLLMKNKLHKQWRLDTFWYITSIDLGFSRKISKICSAHINLLVWNTDPFNWVKILLLWSQSFSLDINPTVNVLLFCSGWNFHGIECLDRLTLWVFLHFIHLFLWEWTYDELWQY